MRGGGSNEKNDTGREVEIFAKINSIRLLPFLSGLCESLYRLLSLKW